MVPIQRSMNAFARGARTGVRMIRMRLGAEHLVEGGRELAVAVVDQEPDRLRPVDERLDDVARLLGRPLAGRVRGDARQIHLPGRELDEHEHVEPTQQHGLDGEEVAGDDAAGLRSQELPARSPTSGAAPDRCRPAAGSTRQCWPRSGHRARRARRGSAGSPSLGSPAPAARSARGLRRRLRACPAADADTSNARDQRPVPTTDRLRPHEHAAPPVARKQPGKRRQEDPIGRPAVRPSTCRRSTANS